MLKRKVAKLLAGHIPGGTSFSHQGGSLADLPTGILQACDLRVLEQEEDFLLRPVAPGVSRFHGMSIDLMSFRVPR